eukprot:TRINITY_DN3900_c0_g1_i1.p1 TRINITY_DN3900_c0_g1~~TRINITY_DN3900_c0_g1_i1.p1  ORF type:complete len:1648 (-),score=367.40 TRINITY_DN3900_c0_g1_i1:40-4983(-)
MDNSEGSEITSEVIEPQWNYFGSMLEERKSSGWIRDDPFQCELFDILEQWHGATMIIDFFNSEILLGIVTDILDMHSAMRLSEDEEEQNTIKLKIIDAIHLNLEKVNELTKDVVVPIRFDSEFEYFDYFLDNKPIKVTLAEEDLVEENDSIINSGSSGLGASSGGLGIASPIRDSLGSRNSSSMLRDTLLNSPTSQRLSRTINQSEIKSVRDSFQRLDTGKLYHIHLSIHNYQIKVGENTELVLYLYSNGVAVSERITLSLIVDETDKSRCFYTLPDEEKTLFFKNQRGSYVSNLKLVVMLIRKGNMKYTDPDVVSVKKKKKGNNSQMFVRRPHAIGTFNLTSRTLLNSTQVIDFYNVPEEITNIKEFTDLIANTSNPSAIQEFRNSKGEFLGIGIRSYAGELDEIVHNNPQLVDATVVQPLELEDDFFAKNYVRNDLYLTLEEGRFELGGKSVEVTVEVFTENGSPVQIISTNRNKFLSEKFDSLVYMRCSEPIWEETIRIDLEELRRLIPNDNEKIFLFFSIYSVSGSEKGIKKSLVSCTYIPIFENGGLINGSKQLNCYKPIAPKDLSKGSVPKTIRGSILLVSFKAASTEICTEDSPLMFLKNWESNKDNMEDILTKCAFLEKTEFIKFSNQYFDHLFNIADSYQTMAYHHKTFEVVVFLFTLIIDAKGVYTSDLQKEILDQYIEEHFNGPNVYLPFLDSLLQIFNSGIRSLRERIMCLKSLKQILSLVIKSRGQKLNEGSLERSIKKMAGQDDTSFRKDDEELEKKLYQILDMLNELMSTDSSSGPMGASQSQCIKTFPTILKPLSNVFSKEKINGIVFMFLDSVHPDAVLPIQERKLTFVLDNLFTFVDMATALNIVKCHLMNSERERDLSLKILKACISHSNTVEDGICDDILNILPFLCKKFKKVEESDQLFKFELMICFFSIIKGWDDLTYDRIRESNPEKFSKCLRRFVNAIYCMILFSFPLTWPELFWFQCINTLKFVEYTTPILMEQDYSLAPNAELDNEKLSIMSSFLALLLACTYHRGLDIDSYILRKELITNQIGDIRSSFYQYFELLWPNFELYQMIIVPDITKYLLLLATDPSSKFKKKSLGIYLKLIVREFLINKQIHFGKQDSSVDSAVKRSSSFAANISIEKVHYFPILEIQTIQALEQISDSSGFNGKVLSDWIENDLAENLKLVLSQYNETEQATAFIGHMKGLISLLVDLNALPKGPEYEEERAFSLSQLMTFLKKTKRKEAYLQYSQQLISLYLNSDHCTEAAFVYWHLLGRDLDWSDELLEPASQWPAQTSSERKLSFYRRAINLFNDGRSWEQAIQVLNELVENRLSVYDYMKVAEYIREQAAFYERIISDDRFYAEYFFVAYLGKDFPKSLRGKMYIYRGLELERIIQFIERMKEKFPRATIIKKKYLEDRDDINNQNGQFLQIFGVAPSSEAKKEGREVYVDTSIPEKIRFYNQVNDVKVFHYNRAWQLEGGKNSEDVSHMCTADYFLTTEDTFPNVHRRIEIVELLEKVYSPVETAATSIKEQINTVSDLLEKHKNGPPDMDHAPLISCSQGIIAAGVNGGPYLYKCAFLTKSHREAHPEDEEYFVMLEEGLNSLMKLARRILSFQATIVPDSMRPLHEKLEEMIVTLEYKLLHEELD